VTDSSYRDQQSRTPIDLRVERYDPNLHDQSGFSCGNPALDAYVQYALARDEDHHTAAGYVLVDTGDPADRRRVIGYFTLNSFGLPKKQARRRDRDKVLGIYDPVPAVLIGRLALDARFQGQELGNALLATALKQVLAIRESLGVTVAVVHAIDEQAAQFYEHFGFTPFRDEPYHLYYPLKTFEATLTEVDELGR
jgi:GNAT superfamily N-acetyltransferase